LPPFSFPVNAHFDIRRVIGGGKTPSKATEKAKAKSEATTKIPQTKGQVNQKTTKGKAGEPKAQ
jgi:hypothetical protein